MSDHIFFTAEFFAFLGGLLLALSFPKVSLWSFAWIAFVPPLYWVTSRNIRLKESFKIGFIFGFSFFMVSLYWIYIVLKKYGGLPFWLSIPVLVLLCAYLALYIAFFMVGAYFFKTRPPLFPLWLTLPSMWVLLEWLRGYVLTGFPWNLLGYSQGDVEWLRQIADITGVYGVSWLVLLFNVLIVRTLFGGNKPMAGWVLFAVLILISWTYGRSVLKGSFSEKAISVAIVQGNIEQAQKWDKDFRDQTIRIYGDLSTEAVIHAREDVQLLVWPETAMPFFYGLEREPTTTLNDIIKDLGVAVLFGSPAVVSAADKSYFLNSAFVVSADGDVVGAYAKEHLVPFGEYVPLKKLLFFVQKLVVAAGDFIPGEFPEPIQWNGEHIGVMICYEAIFPELARRRVLEGATFLVNISNDAWFGASSAPYQHLEIARWRAVETRRFLVRATNTGISGFIDPYGRITKQLELFRGGFIIDTIHPQGVETLYVKKGDIFVLLCLLIIILAAIHSFWKNLKKGRPSYEL